jgi:hypothetical protein
MHGDAGPSGWAEDATIFQTVLPLPALQKTVKKTDPAHFRRLSFGQFQPSR